MRQLIIFLVVLYQPLALPAHHFVWGMRGELDQYQVIARKLKKYIESRTDNKVQIEIKLYDDDPRNPIKKIEEGEFEIYQVTTNSLQQIMPEKSQFLEVWKIPNLFRDKLHVEKYINHKQTQTKLKQLGTPTVLPVTYSYAGGFVSVINHKNKNKINYPENHSFCPFSESGEKWGRFIQSLPCNALLYELDELNASPIAIREKLKINITNHLVVSRITMISKKKLSEIPLQYQKLLLAKLRELLNEERETIYKISQKNINLLKENKSVHLEFVPIQSRDKIKENSLKNIDGDSIVIKEVDFITNLIDS